MSDGFKITRVRRNPYFIMEKSHYHADNEIYYLVNGSRRMFIQDTIYTMNKGDLVVIFRGSLHRTSYVGTESHDRYAMLFGDDYFDAIYDELGKDEIKKIFEYPIVSIPSGRQDHVLDLFNKIKSEIQYDDEYSSLAIKIHFQELLLLLLRCKKYSDVVETRINVNDEVIQESARYVSNNYDKALSLEDVAKHINMSATYFSKRFKEITGFGFKEYLINVRLKEASRQLLETKSSITDIALNCGFNDSNYFGDVFKRVKGISPSQYRKNEEFI